MQESVKTRIARLVVAGTIIAALMAASAFAAEPAQPTPAAAPTPVATPLATVTAAPASPAWPDKLKLDGDFRYRHEYISATPKPASEHRHRIRARFNAAAKLASELNAGFSLATGDLKDPVSTNVTLSDSFVRKSLGVDLAYLGWAFDSDWNLWAGKFKNPLYKAGGSQLIWDNDLNPEGLALKYEGTFQDGMALIVTLPAYWIQERDTDNDSYVLGLQATLKLKLADGYDLTAGASYLNYTNMKAHNGFVDATKDYGNSLGGGKYLNNYDPVEGYAEFTMNLVETPLTLYADYVFNPGAPQDRTGALAGLIFGKVKKAGSWAARYSFRYVEADAVVGAFSDSDFRGGGTNGKGHEFGFDYAAGDVLRVGATYLLNSKGVSAALDYHRVQLDLGFKF